MLIATPLLSSVLLGGVRVAMLTSGAAGESLGVHTGKPARASCGHRIERRAKRIHARSHIRVGFERLARRLGHRIVGLCEAAQRGSTAHAAAKAIETDGRRHVVT